VSGTVFLQVAARNGKSAFLQQKGDTGHADTARADQMDVAAFSDQLLCAINGVHVFFSFSIRF
jgi:hypothetical protein